MQFFATVLAAAAGTATATAVAPLNIAYHVCNFRAGCISHSNYCLVAFNVWQYNSFEKPPGVECDGFTLSRQNGSMVDLLNGHCNSSSRTFNVTFGEQGATLRVTGQVSMASNLTGQTLLPISDWTYENDMTANILTYKGPTELDLELVVG